MVSTFSLVADNPLQGAKLLSGDPKRGVSTWLTRDGRTITNDATTPWYGDLMKAITSAALAAGAGVGGAAALGGGAGGAAGAGGLGGTGALGGVPAAGTGALSAAAPTAASIVPAAGSGLSLGGLIPTLPTLGPVLGSTTLGTMGTGALYGAGTGALGAAVTGGKPLKGALYGGLGGAAMGGLASAFPETAASLGIGPSSSLPTSMPGSSGGGDYVTNTLDENGNVIPLATSGDGSSGGGGALGSIFGGGGGGGKGLSWLDLGAGVLGALGSRPPKPNYGMAPGPSTTAATRGPLFDKPLPSAGAYLNRTPVQNYQPIGNDWYTWGEHAGQPQFYNNNRLTSPNMARGGALSRSMARGGGDHGYVEGEGDGMQDAIPAKLSDGEFVFNADVVSRMGNGSNRKGAQRLEHMRRAVMRDSGIPRVVPKKIRKSPLQYLQEAKGKRR